MKAMGICSASLVISLLPVAGALADDAAECLALMDPDSCLRAIVRDPGLRLTYLEARGRTYIAVANYPAAIVEFSGLLADQALAVGSPVAWGRIMEHRAEAYLASGDAERAVADYHALIARADSLDAAAVARAKAALTRLGEKNHRASPTAGTPP